MGNCSVFDWHSYKISLSLIYTLSDSFGYIMCFSETKTNSTLLITYNSQS